MYDRHYVNITTAACVELIPGCNTALEFSCFVFHLHFLKCDVDCLQITGTMYMNKCSPWFTVTVKHMEHMTIGYFCTKDPQFHQRSC